MSSFRNSRSALLTAILLLLIVVFPAFEQSAPPPAAPAATADPTQPNLFYGAIPPNGANGPVIVFVHGLNGTAMDWWDVRGNTMYDLAYQAGFRTAFVSMNLDNTPNTTDIPTNGAMLQTMFPKILSQFGVTKVYFVCHSKGGLDVQSAIANTQWLGIARAVFMFGTPNQGDALADWLASPSGINLANSLGLNNPGVQSLQTANVKQLRKQWDPIFRNSRVPFYTVSGNTYACPTSQTCSTAITGPILTSLGGTKPPLNDGFVTQPETILPTGYATVLGVIHTQHFALRLGTNSFPFIFGHVNALETQQPGAQMVSTAGFGDGHNTWAWSMQWFKGKLYVGTGREIACVTTATAMLQTGLPLYPPNNSNCPADYHHLPLQAEIWQYTPATRIWVRVYQSPNAIPIVDSTGAPMMTALDIGYRGMTVVTEPDGTQALYVGAVTSASLFAPQSNHAAWPPPRILRYDGVHPWAPLPQTAGTFLGNLTQGGSQQYPILSVRAAAQLNGTLFLQVGDLQGTGRVISTLPTLVQNVLSITQAAPMVVTVASVAHMASGETLTIAGATPSSYNGSYTVTAVDGTSNTITLNNTTVPGSAWTTGGTVTTVANPANGDNAFEWASPTTDQLPVWILEKYNNFLYAGTGFPNGSSQYGVYKTDGTGTAPYNWTPVVINGAYAQGLISNYAMSMQVFSDSSNCLGIGCLYVGTDRPTELIRIHPDDSWDLVIGNPRTIPAGQPGAGQVKAPISSIGQYFANGFNGHFWRMGVGGQGLYLSTWDNSDDDSSQVPLSSYWSQEFGTDVYRTNDGVHWQIVSKIAFGDGANTGGRSYASTPFGLFWGTARSLGGTQIFNVDNSILDYNHDGVIDLNDIALLNARLNTAALPNDPMDLNQDGKITSADARLLASQCTNPNCVVPAKLPPYVTLPAPVVSSAPGVLGGSVSLTWNAVSGAQDYLVYRITTATTLSAPPPGPPSSGALFGYPGPITLLTRVSSPAYTEASPTSLQSLYFIRTEDASGNLSAPSNVVGGPSLASQ